MVSLWKSRCEWEDDFPSANFLTSKQGKWEWWCGERVLGEFWWETNSWKPANLPYPFKKWRWWWSLCWPLRGLKAFTLESSNRIYTKIIATNPLNTSYQSCQTAIGEKFFYSSSFKWLSYCSLANLILPFKYSFFSLLHFVWHTSLPQLRAKQFGPQTVPISPTRGRPADLPPLWPILRYFASINENLYSTDFKWTMKLCT